MVECCTMYRFISDLRTSCDGDDPFCRNYRFRDVTSINFSSFTPTNAPFLTKVRNLTGLVVKINCCSNPFELFISSHSNEISDPSRQAEKIVSNAVTDNRKTKKKRNAIIEYIWLNFKLLLEANLM